jgi:hypothetical protein
MNKIGLKNNGIGFHLSSAWMSEREHVLKAYVYCVGES